MQRARTNSVLVPGDYRSIAPVNAAYAGMWDIVRVECSDMEFGITTLHYITLDGIM